MIELNIKGDIKKGFIGKCDATKSSLEEIAMMLCILNKYKNRIQKQFDKLSNVEFEDDKTEFFVEDD